MANRLPKVPETQALLEEIRVRQIRRRRLQIAAAVLTGLALAFLLGGAAVAVLRSTMDTPEPPAPVAGGLTTTTVRRAATTPPPPPRPSTTEPVGDTAPPASQTASTAAPATDAPPPEPVANLGVVVIDPGHQSRGSNQPEPIGPGSAQTKPRVTSGTRGVATGTPEHELVLAVGLKLKAALEARGIEVVMTRTTADVDLSNIERTQIANAAKADLYVRLHADGSPQGSRARGIHVLYPASVKGWTDDIAEPSRRAAELAQAALIAGTQAPDLGIDAREDMTGFNWSDVPVVLPEIGFMTNPDEDRLLASDAYRQKIADALAEAAAVFLDERRASR
jgi:N-acetylmuramoyl-L-alanine amidase